MRRVATVLLLVATLATFGGTVRADGGRPAMTEKAAIDVVVTIIGAGTSKKGVDKGLERFQSYFTRSFSQFSDFKNLGERRMTVAKDALAEELILDGKKLTIRYVDFDTERRFIRMEVQFDGARMTMQVKNGGLWFHAGRKLGDGILVLALEATVQN